MDSDAPLKNARCLVLQGELVLLTHQTSLEIYPLSVTPFEGARLDRAAREWTALLGKCLLHQATSSVVWVVSSGLHHETESLKGPFLTVNVSDMVRTVGRHWELLPVTSYLLGTPSETPVVR